MKPQVTDQLIDNPIIDEKLTFKILKNYNKGLYKKQKILNVKEFPVIDNKTIVDMTNDLGVSFDKELLKFQLNKYNISFSIKKSENDNITLTKDDLIKIGKQLMPLYSFGILNGGSATSYCDQKKNKSFNENLFQLYKEPFEKLASLSKGKAKGITPAFINPNGTEGPSFLELKLRSLILNNCHSLFQMTSFFTNESINKALEEYRRSPIIFDLLEENKKKFPQIKTGIQALLAAYSHSSEGDQKSLFRNKDEELLAIPGGHGQCFYALKKVFIELYHEGCRFVSLGNIDNIGYTPDPLSLAIIALNGKSAAFEFSFKTPVDIKGGVLIVDQKNKLNCADLGVAISNEQINKAENEGKPILFNCATGLFNLELLIENIDTIIESLPMRFSDQNKDAGLYSQAEQVTWEIIGLLDDINIFAIDKYKRFLASKTIMENLMTSGIKLNDPAYPQDKAKDKSLQFLGQELNKGLHRVLKKAYGLQLEGGTWISQNRGETSDKTQF